MKKTLVVAFLALVALSRADAPAPQLTKLYGTSGCIHVSWSYPTNLWANVESWTITRSNTMTGVVKVYTLGQINRPKESHIHDSPVNVYYFTDTKTEHGAHYDYRVQANWLEEDSADSEPLPCQAYGPK